MSVRSNGIKVHKSAYYECEYYVDHDLEYILVDQIEVYDEFRRQGIGTGIVNSLLDQFEGYSINGVIINPDAVKFWRNFDPKLPKSDESIGMWLAMYGHLSFTRDEMNSVKEEVTHER